MKKVRLNPLPLKELKKLNQMTDRKKKKQIGGMVIRLQDTAFTRNRILTFPKLMLFILGLPRKTLATDLLSFLAFFDQQNPHISKQAFSSARQNISPDAFLQLLRDSYQLASFQHSDGLWHGHCVKAIDGTTLRLPNTPENKAEFGTQKNQSDEYAMAKAPCLYDISHDLIEDVVLSNCRDSEKNHAFQLLEQGPSLLSPEKRPLILFDRGVSLTGNDCFFKQP